MSRGNGKKESRDRTDGASGIDRIHSVDGGRSGSWSLTEVENDSDGSRSTVGGNDGPVEEKAWFEPVGNEEISDCPGGICPVPWAKDNEEEKRSAKEKRKTPREIAESLEANLWDTYLAKHKEIWEEDIDLASDPVNHPAHYTSGSIECIEAIEAQLTREEYRGYLKGCVAKYVWRERQKGSIESLQKAQWYIDRLINLD